MIFFLNTGFNAKNSGIEHAELGRARLFKQFQQPFQFLLRNWNPQLHSIMNGFGIEDDAFVSLFDFYQGTTNVASETVLARDIDFGLDQLSYQEEPANHRYLVTRGKQFVGRINLFPANTAGEQPVRSVEQFDMYGNLYKVDCYDERGFVSLSQWYSPDNKVETECWFNATGIPVIETFNRKDAVGRFGKSGWRLFKQDGSMHVFNTLDQLYLEFLNDMNAAQFDPERPNIFILDRSDMADWSLTELRQPAYTVMHLHNAHIGNPQDPMHSILNNHYEYAMYNANTYDALIAATDNQTCDVTRRFKPQAKLFTIPVGIVAAQQLLAERIPMSARRPGSILVTARVAPEKQLDQLVRAVGIARQQVAEVSLDIYGYVDHRDNDQALKAVQAAIAEYHLEDVVHLHDYVQDVAAVQDQAQIYGLTSVMEGFNLALMEAQAHGEVGLTYDVNYGPNELVEDGKNGFVVPYADVNALADRLVALLTDSAALQAKSDAAYELSQRFSPASVWHQWQALLADAQATWPGKLSQYRLPIAQGL